MQNGETVNHSEAQQSIHIVAGNEYDFKAMGRKFKMISEVYYKKLDNLIPYEVDNVRVQYYAEQRARGYTAGVDMKIGGEFVPGVDSWFSLSFLKTEEDVYDIGDGTDDGAGYIPRPTDQLFSAGIFFQDYIPGRQNFKVHLNLLYGSSLPFGPPHTERKNAADLRMPDYKRVDIGFSAVLLAEEKEYSSKFLKKFKSIWLTAEVFNLLGVNNTISYLWVKVIPNSSLAINNISAQYAVPNHLTSRRLNMKLTVRF